MQRSWIRHCPGLVAVSLLAACGDSDNPPDPPPPPALNPNSEFQGVAASLSEGDVIAVAEVRKDGAAANVTYPVPPNDPSVQEKLSTAMSQRGIFQGIKPNQFINPIAVVYLSSITTTSRF